LKVLLKIQLDIQEIEKLSNIFNQQQESLPVKIKSLTNQFSIYLKQFDQTNIERLNYLSTLFGTGLNPEFPLHPNSFVIFVSSIYDKIIQLHETSKKYDGEILQLNKISGKKRLIHSNSLDVLLKQAM
jgi:hypothetical protein